MSFQPAQPDSGFEGVVNHLNKLVAQVNKEQSVKAFRQSGGNAIVQGKMPQGGYGAVYYDSSNTARILIGQDPDGNMAIHVSKDGEDVVEDVFS